MSRHLTIQLLDVSSDLQEANLNEKMRGEMTQRSDNELTDLKSLVASERAKRKEADELARTAEVSGFS